MAVSFLSPMVARRNPQSTDSHVKEAGRNVVKRVKKVTIKKTKSDRRETGGCSCKWAKGAIHDVGRREGIEVCGMA